MAQKTYSQELVELRKYTKLLYKTFTENETGDIYQLVMFSLEYGSRQLSATLCLTTHTAYKVTVPITAFKSIFTALNEDTRKDLVDADVVT